MPLVSRDGRSETVQAAKSAELQVNLLQAKTRQDLELLVEKTWREAAQGLEEYHSLSTQALAEENVRLRDKAFGQGLSTSLDVVDAQTQLAGVKTQRRRRLSIRDLPGPPVGTLRSDEQFQPVSAWPGDRGELMIARPPFRYSCPFRPSRVARLPR